jgi:hypothetical protein
MIIDDKGGKVDVLASLADRPAHRFLYGRVRLVVGFAFDFDFA